MKTVLILNYEYPPLGGGAGVCTQYQSEGLSQMGYRVIVITTWFSGEKEYEKKGNLEIYRLKSQRKLKHKSDSIEKLDWVRKTKKFLVSFLEKNTIDITLGNFTILGGEVGYFLKKKYHIPYIIISHGHDIPWFFRKQMFLYHIVTYFWIKKVCKFADKIILLTQEMKQNADNFLKNNTQNHYIIPNGCETNIFVPNQNVKSKKFQIIFVGRLVEQKDPMTFLYAIHRLKLEHNLDFQVDILGDGPLKEDMTQFVKQNHLEQNIIFHGWVDKVQMLSFYQQANLQVITSLAEAMSIATLESLSTGQYILSTPVSGNTDMIKKGINGDFFDYKNVKELKDKIYEYYENKFLSNYVVEEKYLEDFRVQYDWKKIVTLYDDLISSSLTNGK